MSSSDWITIDYARLNTTSVKTVDGVEVSARLSPYDVPMAVRGRGSDAGGVLVEFKYLDDEPLLCETTPDGLVVCFGRHSGRLFSIEVPLPVVKTGADKVSKLVEAVVL